MILGSNLILNLNLRDMFRIAAWDRDALLRFGVSAQVLRIRIETCFGLPKKKVPSGTILFLYLCIKSNTAGDSNNLD